MARERKDEQTVIEQPDKTDEFIETVAPSDAPRVQKIKWGDWEREYTQTRLSLIPKLRWVKMTSQTFRTVMREGFSVGELMGISEITVDEARRINSTDAIVRGIFNLMELAPEYVEDLIIMALNVPPGERQIVSEILQQPHDDETGAGGLTDEDGEEIIMTFVAQNAKAIADFFAQRLVRIGKAIQETINPDLIQESLTQSNPTQATTPKR